MSRDAYDDLVDALPSDFLPKTFRSPRDVVWEALAVLCTEHAAIKGTPVPPTEAEAYAAYRESKRWRVFVQGLRPAMLDDIGIRDIMTVVEEVGDDPATWWSINLDGTITSRPLVIPSDLLAVRPERSRRLHDSRKVREELDEKTAALHNAQRDLRALAVWFERLLAVADEHMQGNGAYADTKENIKNVLRSVVFA